MGKRKRNIPLFFWVTEDEKALIEQKMREHGVSNMSAFLRKMAIDGYSIRLDFPELRELVSLMRRSSNNMNQVAKRVNATGRMSAWIILQDFRTIRRSCSSCATL